MSAFAPEVFWAEFTHLITDPAHTLVEFCFVAIDYLVIQTVVSRVKDHFHRDLASEHARIEAEHGLVHPQVFDLTPQYPDLAEFPPTERKPSCPSPFLPSPILRPPQMTTTREVSSATPWPPTRSTCGGAVPAGRWSGGTTTGT